MFRTIEVGALVVAGKVDVDTGQGRRHGDESLWVFWGPSQVCLYNNGLSDDQTNRGGGALSTTEGG